MQTQRAPQGGEPPRGQPPAQGQPPSGGPRGTRQGAQNQAPPGEPQGRGGMGQANVGGRAGQQYGQQGPPGGQPAGPQPGMESSQRPPPPQGAPGLAPLGVDDLLQSDVVTAEPDTPVATVVAEMAEKNVGSVVVVEDDSPVGIVTDRGVALALETTPDVSEHPVEELMEDELVTGSTDMNAVDALRRLSEAGVRRLPIVDEEGDLAGIVTVDDVLVTFSEELRNVADVIRTQSPRS